jgi:uncharacterized Fe-S cluster-containing radical SAM superfamily protein
VLCAKRLLLALQRSLVHLLGLRELALVRVEDSKVVNCVERRCVLCAKRLLLASQRSLVHLLGLREFALVSVKKPKVKVCPIHIIVYKQVLQDNIKTPNYML